MSEDDLVVIADSLSPQEAGMMRALLASAGIAVVSPSAGSSQSDRPEQRSELAVKSADAPQARAVLAGAETTMGKTSSKRPPPFGLIIGGIVAAILLYLSLTETG